MISSKNAFDLGIRWQFPEARRYTFVFLVLFFVLILIYSNSFDCSFHFDDTPNILSNPNVQPESLSWEELKKSFYGRHLDQEEIKRPFSYMTLAINYYFSGKNVFSYHVVNFVVHCISAGFLFLLIYNTLKLPLLRQRYEKSAYAIVLLAVFFWATHPIQLTAVTYIVQRMASLAGMFYVMAMYFYLKARTNPRSGRQIIFYGLCSLAALLAFASKENAAMLPVVLFLFDLFLIQGVSRENLKRAAWFAGAAMLVFVVLAFIYVDLSFFLSGYEDRPFTLPQRLMTQPRILMIYISLLLYPVSSRLMFIHDVPLSQSLIDPWTTVASILLILTIIVAALYYSRKWPLIAFCVIFFFINHVIESSIVPLELVYEHRNYIPSMFLFVLAAIVMVRVLDYFSYKPAVQFLMAFGFCFLLAAQAHTTYDRNKIWQNEILLWSRNAAKAPKLSRVHTNLGKAYAEIGIQSESVKHFKKALRLKRVMRKDGVVVLLHNAAMASFHEGENKTAVEYFQKALHLANNGQEILASMCRLYLKEGELDKAYREIRSRVKDFSKIRSEELLHVCALVMYHMDRPRKSIELAGRALEQNSEYYVVYPVIAQSYIKEGNWDKAKTYWHRYLDKQQRSLNAHLAVIELYAKTGNEGMLSELVADFLCLVRERKGQFCDLMSRTAKNGDEDFLKAYQPDLPVLKKAIKGALHKKAAQFTEAGCIK